MRATSSHGRWAGPLASVLIVLLSGCEARGVGDPCIPEALPPSGLFGGELYVESGSAQCLTRTCVAFGFDGDPSCVFDDELNCPAACDGVCSTRDEVLLHLHCSCRCSAGTGSVGLPTCECGAGFHCVDRIDATGGPPVDGYCVHNEADPLFCDEEHPCGEDAACVRSRCRAQ